MKSLFLLLSITFVYTGMHGQPPANGKYTYKIVFAESGGKYSGNTCTVIIKGDSIKIIANAKTNLSLTKTGDIIDQGRIIKHTKTGKWIISHSPKDKDAKEVGGCSDGPQVIDFKNKKFWIC